MDGRSRGKSLTERPGKEPYRLNGIADPRRKALMPTIIVNMWPGRDDNSKRRIAEGITKVFENEKVPRDVVEVIMYEVPKNNWARGGKLHSD